ncbi:MAG: DNA polymerase III subunit delta [Chthoniobacteraceae bacterium]
MAAAAKAASAKTQIHAVLGTDESEVKRVSRELAERLTPPGGDDFGREIIDGTANNADEAASRIHQTIQALLTFPFFGGEKLVWLKHATFLGDTQTGKAAAVLEGLEKLLEVLNSGLPESVRFLISATEIDKRRSFYKQLGKLATVEVYDKLDSSKSGWEEDAAMMVRQLAQPRGLKFDGDALELFTLFTGGDRRLIGNELEKLELYVASAPRVITSEDVRLLVPMSRSGIIWELGNAVAERNLRRSLDLLDQLLFQGESAIGILIVAIIPSVRNLLIVKDLMVRHKLSKPAQPFFFGKQIEKLPPEATMHLPRKKDGGLNTFALGIAATHAHRYTLPELEAALHACLDANVQLVNSILEPKAAISHLLVKITGERPKNA